MIDILIIFGLILLNGIFAMSELAIVSSKRIRLQGLSDHGSRGAKAALDLADSPSHFLSTVQVGITLIGIFNGAFGEASLVSRLTPEIASVPMVSAYAREIALGIVVTGITFFSLIFGELVPKRIAMQYPEAVAAMMAVPMQWLSRLAGPFVKILAVTTDFLLRILRLNRKDKDTVTEADIASLLQQGTNAGLFEKTEHDIVSRALRLDDQRIGSLMTPRMDIHYIDVEAPIDVNLGKIADSPYNRFPVCKGGLGNVLGILHAGRLFEQVIRGQSMSNLNIVAAVNDALFIPETISAMQLLETFKQHRAEIALVIDEYGDIEGLVTLSDVLGALVGDVSTLDEHHEADAVRRDDGTWLIDGGVSFNRFRELLGTDIQFPEESSGNYHTLAGFVMAWLGHVPNVGEYFEWEQYRIEVMDMDRNRIDRLLIAPISIKQTQTENS